MGLTSGTKLGPYEIAGALGAGGMGEVYRARDTKLGREVALKVLPEAFVRDAERMARFRREAQVLASLNHPNIAAIYGFEDSGITHALVMELVEGPTLAERIKQGAIPLDEALPIAKQISEAMEYAHERGIVHRDLKPANIKLANNDAVKVLDFGLAKALEDDPASVDISSSPTISRMATQAGIILGTAAYMSPEQAKGKSVDRRTDIWAFGCVLFEMLSGKRLFTGETTSDTLAEVLKMEPEWSALPANTPTRVRELLARCLQKTPRQRLQSIGDARIAIEEVLSGAFEQSVSISHTAERRSNRELVAWVLVAVLALLAIGVGVWAWLAPRTATTLAALAYIPPPPGTSLRSFGFGEGPVVVSPDGKDLAFSATDQKGVTKIWVRPLVGGQATAVAGTDDGARPFWSADSQSLAFFSDGNLKTVALESGTVRVLGDSSCDSHGGAWSEHGVILFTPQCDGPMDSIPAGGGNPQLAVQPTSGTSLLGLPAFLPGGQEFLYVSQDKGQSPSIQLASLSAGKSQLILDGARSPQFASGNLLFVRGGKVFAQRFDPASGKTRGEAMPLAEAQSYSASDNGALAFQGGTADARLEWFDRNGNSLGTIGDVQPWVAPKISPDGKQVLAVGTGQGGMGDLWSYPAAGGVGTRLTFGPGRKVFSVWSPDGKYIAYGCSPGGTVAICRKPADGSSAEETLLKLGPAAARLNVVDWSPDGRELSFDMESTKDQRWGSWVLPLDGSQKLFQPAAVDAAQYDGNFSPDGHWFAYFSYETGRPEVFVVPFPATGGKYQISQTSGWAVRWADGDKLFFLTMGDRLMEADLTAVGKSLHVKSIEPLFQLSLPSTEAPLFDVTSDGTRFIVASSADPAASSSITLLLNWPALLKKQQ